MADALVLQCGGPTAVINASLWGVISAWQAEGRAARLWGARHGLRGLAQGDWVELTEPGGRAGSAASLELQPGAALGSGRDRLRDEDLPQALDGLRGRSIGFVFIIGGNGSMAAAQKLDEGARSAGYQAGSESLRVIAIPKTIDNDLAGTDVCPGYGSAARFIAQTVRDVGLDQSAMRGFDDVAVIEVMGRHVGWLAAASALARWDARAAPHLILLPEVPLDEAGFLATVRDQHQRDGVCVVVAAEGIQDGQGTFLAEKLQPLDRDASGHKLLALTGGPTPYLARLVREQLGLRCRQIRPDVIQRSSSALVSAVDRALARQVGSAAVKAAAEGYSGVMIALERQGEEWRTAPVPLGEVTRRERSLPPPFIDPRGFGVTAEFLAYARPLVGDWSPGALLF